MKKLIPISLTAILILTITIALSGCGGGGVGTTYTPGQVSVYTVGGVSFNLCYVPSAASFPTGIDDDTPGVVSSPFWMAETEVTYELWNAVRTWAVSNSYSFTNVGRQGGGSGSDPVGTTQHPVTTISWRDAIVWCNALTEYNDGNSSNCVYYSDVSYTIPIRSASYATIDTPYIKAATTANTFMDNCTAKGFRLPPNAEWELAARYRGTDVTNTVAIYSNPYFTKGNSASGATADNTNVIATGAVAWYSESSTRPVGGKTANALNIKDMSGNVAELCFDIVGSTTKIRFGGSWSDGTGSALQVGSSMGDGLNHVDNDIGFRPVRTQ